MARRLGIPSLVTHRAFSALVALLTLVTPITVPTGTPEAAEAAEVAEVAGGADVDAAAAGRFARLALDCVHQEYPNKIAHVLQEDADAKPPRQLTPAFYGCYDWHSAVHGHWLLARLARSFPEAPFAADARAALAKSLAAEHIATEVAYLNGEGRRTFERPYGLAWLLQLAAELAEWAKSSDDPEARGPAVRGWSENLAPLEAVAAERFAEWLPKLGHPIRTGEHSQTAFAFGLALDWARQRGRKDLEDLLTERSRALYLQDRDCPLDYEPSGQDFLSPCLAEADLLRRLLPPPVFAAWLGRFLPGIPWTDDETGGAGDWLVPAVVTDPTDGKLAHLDGLNLSRAWMLEGILRGLPEDDPRRPALASAARRHRDSGLASVTGEHYEGGHWLGSFAVYLVTGRGLECSVPSCNSGS